jgi:hypothetical protein
MSTPSAHEPPRTVVTFRSGAFNTSEPRAGFVNPNCFGDDLAAWLIDRLRARGVETDEQPGAEDFGWYLRFRLGDARYCAVVGHRPDDGPGEGDWAVWLERDAGLLGSLLGRREQGILPEVARLLHQVLSASEDVRDVRWHVKADFDAGRGDRATDAP